MSLMNAKLSEAYRTKQRVNVDADNKITQERFNLLKKIKEQSGGDKETAFNVSMTILRDNIAKVQQYILMQGEVPADDVEHLALQAYELRCKQIQTYQDVADVNAKEANILLEEEESQYDNDRSVLGSMFAPIKIIASQIIEKPHDNLVDPALVSGIVDTLGTKISSADLIRAAQNKPAGILGFLGTGGTKAYDTMRKYLNDPANAQIKQAVLNRQITDPSQIQQYIQGTLSPTQPGTGSGLKVFAKDVIDTVSDAKKKEYIKKYLPYAIVGIVAIILITYFISKRK